MKNRTGILNFLQPFTLLMRSTIRKAFQTIQNQENYFENVQNTYDELHAPEGLRRKVMNMSEMNGKKKGMSVVKKLAVAAAIAAVLFAGSNGVAYAMTGSTWVETEDAETSSEVIEVAEENGRIYLLAGDMKLDITEDMTDGAASGSYEKNGVTFEYEVREQPGAPGCYELHILSEDK